MRLNCIDVFPSFLLVRVAVIDQCVVGAMEYGCAIAGVHGPGLPAAAESAAAAEHLALDQGHLDEQEEKWQQQQKGNVDGLTHFW